jgi:salicylate synthetase
LPSKDGWDSIRSNITVPALLKERNSEAIEAFEPYPRELYGGSVVMIDGPAFFEAALVLRSVFQDQGRQWLQAGAGVTALSDAVREFTETCEKLASVAPYLVAESETEGIGSFMEAA